MMKRSFLLAAAAGLVASLAFATPSHAAGTIVTTNVNYGSLTNTTALTDIDIFYNGAGTISGTPTFQGFAFDYNGTSYTPVSPITITPIGTLGFDLHFTGGATLLSGSFKFNSSTSYASAPSTITVSMVTTAPAGHGGQVSTSLSFTPAVVPEPSSMALLGIGMTGFLAFRRFFKRTSVA